MLHRPRSVRLPVVLGLAVRRIATAAILLDAGGGADGMGALQRTIDLDPTNGGLRAQLQMLQP